MMWIFFFFFFFFSLKEMLFFNSLFFLESASIFMCSVVPLIPFLIFNSSENYLTFKHKSILFFLVALSVFLVSLCFFTSNHFIFLFLVEGTVVPMTLLMIMFSKDKDKISSTFFMLLMNMLGSIPFMLASMNMGLYLGYPLLLSGFTSFSSYLPFFCLCLILCCKLPVFLLHFWLTKAHVSGSGSCSMLLASVMLKMGSFGLIKFSSVIISASMYLISPISCMSLFGSLLFCLYMLRFSDVKTLIACSSLIHMSFIFPFSLFCSPLSVGSSMLMMTSHGLSSYFLFYLASLLYETSFSRSMDFNKSMDSISKPLFLTFYLFLLINVGVPPMINFMSELYFFYSFFKLSSTMLIPFFLSTLIVILFTMFICTKFLFGKKSIMVISDHSESLYLHSLFYFYSLIVVLYFF